MTPQTGRWPSQILAWAFGTHLFLGSILFVNALQLSFFYYFPRKIEISIIDPRTDSIVWLVSIVCLSALSTWFWRAKKNSTVQAGIGAIAIALVIATFAVSQGHPDAMMVYSLFTVGTGELLFLARHSQTTINESSRGFLSRVLVYCLVYAVAIEVSSATHYVMKSFDPSTGIGMIDSGIELQWSYVGYGLLPWLYVAFLFSWAWVPIVLRLSRRTETTRSTSESSLQSSDRQMTPKLDTKRVSLLLDPRLFVAVAVAAFIGYYPYFQNPPWLVGTDAYWIYYGPLMRVNEQGIAGGFAQTLRERHPLALVLLYVAQLVFHTSAFEVMRLTPLLLVVGCAFATCWLLRGSRAVEFGLLAFLLSVLSAVTAVGMYSSIISNWMALVIWICFFALTASRCDSRLRVSDAILLLALSTAVLLIHPWSWGVFAASVAIFAVVTLVRERKRRMRDMLVLISVIALDAVFALVSLTLLASTQGWRVAESVELYTFVLKNPSRLLVFWDALTRLTKVWAPFYSLLGIALSILGVFALCVTDSTPSRRRLVLAWVCASAIGSILVAPIGYNLADPARGETQLWRLLFLTPFWLTAPFGVSMILGFIQGPSRSSSPFASGMTGAWDSGVLCMIIVTSGVLLAFAPAQLRLVILVMTAMASGLMMARARDQEGKILSSLVVFGFLLVAFNYTTRCLAQLLLDPHNHTP